MIFKTASLIAACAALLACSEKAPSPEAVEGLSDTLSPALTPPPVTGADSPVSHEPQASSNASAPSDPWAKAKAAGADFRAVGQEPGWYLLIDNDGRSIEFVGDYGEKRVTVSHIFNQIELSEKRTIYSARSDSTSRSAVHVVVEVLKERCQDSMSGEEFEAQVRVSVDRKEYKGCGRAL